MACPLVQHGFGPDKAFAACPLVRTALPRQSLRSRPLVRMALDPTKPSLLVRYVRTAFTRQSLRSRPLARTALDTAKLSFPSDTSARLGGPSKALVLVRFRSALDLDKALRTCPLRTHGFATTTTSFPSASYGLLLTADNSLRTSHDTTARLLPEPETSDLVRTLARLWHGKAYVPVRYVRTARDVQQGPSLFLNLDAPARYYAVHVTTRCYGLFYHCNTWLTYDPLYEPETRSTHPRLTQRTVITGDTDLPTSTDPRCQAYDCLAGRQRLSTDHGLF